MSPQLRTATGPISYSLSGPQDSGTRDLVLVHGWCCDRSALAPLRERLERTHRVLSLDLRGHGQSREVYDDGSAGAGARRDDQDEPAAGTVATSIEEFADDVLAVGREAGLRSPVVIGHSLGGLVALAALDRADAGATVPVGAVLLDPAPLAHERGKAFWADQVQPVSRDHTGDLRRDFARSLVLSTDTADYSQVVEVMAAVSPRVAAGGAQAMSQFDGAAVLGRLSAPILVVHAATAERDLDRLVPDRTLMTQGRTVGAGHFHQFEVPDQLESMIERWLVVTELPDPRS